MGATQTLHCPELADTPALVSNLLEQIDQLIFTQKLDQPLVIGIHTGGVWVAKVIAQHLQAPLGQLDITFYRDDFSKNGLHPQVSPSSLPFNINDRHVLLVDDVLMSGRTIRAAMNELFDFGRPASIKLITLCSVNQRELPIQADACALSLDLEAGKYLQLQGPDTLKLSIIEHANHD
ncbi:MAG: bifunctional pyr operon transcriptional regulator/uracil phosphoribosyltransferase PyrR [Pseudomonadales bacterium]|jgi:pyrimidine operon attenuation protein/uracil phosphoribosyltransferase|tara:strand:- start:135 stop:668 length:534 start_codon:yes stop_codon:yes gene_type:complete